MNKKKKGEEMQTTHHTNRSWFLLMFIFILAVVILTVGFHDSSSLASDLNQLPPPPLEIAFDPIHAEAATGEHFTAAPLQWVEAAGILNNGMSSCGMSWLDNLEGNRTWWIRSSELLTDIASGTAIVLKGWLYHSQANACQTSPIIDPTEVCLLPDSDVNADGWVDVVDLQLVAAFWRAESFHPRVDVNHDGMVDVVDLVLVSVDFGLNRCQMSTLIP